MSTTIDNRIVEMKFNNKQFESGAKTTLNTLDKLKASLNFDAAAQSLQRGFSGIERSLALDGIAQGVDTISTRFSALGVVGATVLSNLTTQAMGLISRLNSLVVNPIIEGGKTRAQNIEHAKFQLEGLKVAWEDIEPDISYGVQDTAYGLDAAATVASQLVASNVQLGDSMKAALRGVSGVAAMTSSSYEEIGHIFTTVAGQGRLMGMQLTQLSMRGINAAATLGSALHKTEAEIRDMVSKGQIDFETFAKAMDEAYGLHATAANKTFTGALSNTRAALSRIGAKFATPAYDDLKDALNGLIPVINGVNKSLDPFVDMMSKEMKNASATVVGILAKIDENKIKTLSSIISDSVVVLQNTKDLIISLVKPINQAFRETFPDSALTRLSEFTLKLSEVSKSFKASDERLNKLKNTFKGLFSIVSLFGTVIKGVISAVTPYANAVSNLFDPVLDRLSSFGSGISAFQKSTSGNNAFFENLNEILNYIRISLERVSPKLRAFKEAVQSFISPFQTSFNSERLLNVLRFFTTGLTEEQAEKAMVFSKILARIAEAVVNIGTAVAKVASSVSGAVQEMFPDVGLTSVLSVVRAISEFTEKLIMTDETSEKLKSTFKGVLAVFDIAAQLFSAIVRSIFPATNGIFSLGSGLASVTGSIGDWLVQLDESLKENDTFYNAIQAIVNFIKVGFEKAKTYFLDFYKQITGEDFKMPTMDDIFEKIDKLKEKLSWVPGFIAKVREGFVGLFKWFSEDTSGQKAKSVETIISIMDKLSTVAADISPGISDFFSNIGKAFDKVDFERMGKIINIGMFVVAINALIKLRGAISGLFNWNIFKNANGVLVGTRSALTAWTNDFKYNSYVKIAQAIGILTASLVALSMIDERRLTSAMGAMTSLFIELFGAMALMTNLMAITGEVTGTDPSKNLITIAAATVVISVAMGVLASSIAKLGGLEPAQLASGISAVLGLMAAISLMSVALTQKSNGTILQTAGALVGFSVALEILAGALAIVGKVDKAGSSLAVLFGAVMIFGAATAMWSSVTPAMLMFAGGLAFFASSLVAISASIMVFSVAMKALDGVKDIWQKLAVLVVGLAALTGAALLLGNFAGAIISASIGMAVLAGALAAFVPVIALLGKTDASSIIKALVGLTAGLVLIGGIAAGFGDFALEIAAFGASLIVVSASLIAMGAAFSAFLPVLIAFGNMNLSNIGKAMLVLAGVLVIFGAASYVLTPMIPTMIALSAALLSFGIAALAVGAGLAALSIGIGLLAGVATSLVDTIISLGMALLVGIEVLSSKIIEVAFVIVTKLVVALARYLPIIVESGVMLILGLLKGIESHLGDIILVVGEILVVLIYGLGAIAPKLVDAGVVLIVKLINGMADAIRENSEPLFNALRNLTSSIVEFAITALQQLARNIPYIGNTIYDGLEDAKKAVREFIAPESFEKEANASAHAFSKGFGGATDDAEESGSGLGKAITSGLGSALPDFSSLGSNLGIDFSNGLGSTNGLSFNAASLLGDSAGNALNIDFSELGLSSGDTYSAGLLSSEDGLVDTTGILTDSATGEFFSADSLFGDAGISNGERYAIGLGSQTDKASIAGSKLSNSGENSIISKSENYRAAGHDAGTGFANGLFLDSRAEVYDAGGNLAQVALNAMRQTLDEHSPSKETKQIGNYAGDGLVNGLVEKFDVVHDTSRTLAERSMKAMRNAVMFASSRLTDGIEVDPVIRPVVDFSDVANGVAAINGLMSNRSISLGEISGVFSANSTVSFSGAVSELKNVGARNANQINQSLSELRADVSMLREAISKMRIVMDSGALVGEIIDPLDQALGRRIVMKGRGV